MSVVGILSPQRAFSEGGITSIFVIHSATRCFAFANILRYFHMLWVGGIGVKILPSAEGACEANIMIGVLGVRDIDAYSLDRKSVV